MKETLQKVGASVQCDKNSKPKQLSVDVVEGATRKWVKGFNNIPYGIVEKLLEHGEELEEITPFTVIGTKSRLPIWGTLFSFDHPGDNQWLENEDNLLTMANLGFRIFKQEDYGYIFGIDGAGYDFYEAHWIPLYKARGLRWHCN